MVKVNWWLMTPAITLALVALAIRLAPLFRGPLTPRHALGAAPPPRPGFWQGRAPRGPSAADRAVWGPWAETSGWSADELHDLAADLDITPGPPGLRAEHERRADHIDPLVTTALDLETWLAQRTISHRGWYLDLEAATRQWLDAARADLAAWRYQTYATDRWRPDAAAQPAGDH